MADRRLPIRSFLTRGALLCAVALALPAYLQTKESFDPVDQRGHAEGTTATWSFNLPAADSLFLEFAATVRTDESVRPTLAIDLNGTPIARVIPERLYAPERAKIPLPLEAVRAGANQLTVRLDGGGAGSVDFDGRVHNYFGINPRFPRVYVVSDEAAARFPAELPLLWRAARAVTFYLASLLAVWLLSRPFRSRGRLTTSVVMLAPSVLLWGTLAYSLATPLHVWFSLDGLLVAAVIPTLVVLAGLWTRAHSRAVLQAVGVTIVTLASLEVGLRLYQRVRPTYIFYSESYDRYRGRPGAAFYDFHLNSRGFHDIEHAVERPAGVAWRIVALGDSFALGAVPYRANYLTRLETELADAGPVEVINMGVPAAEPRHYLALLLQEGLQFRPDLVMAGVFIGNDFETVEKKWYEYSYVATLVNFLIQVWRAAPADGGLPGGAPSTYQDDHPTFSRERFLEIEVDRSWIYATPPTELNQAMVEVIGDLRKMRDVSRNAGADFVVVIIPDEAQVEPALFAEIARARGWSPGQSDVRLPNRLLSAQLTAAGISHLDLLPAFEEEGQRARLYRPMDTHWNIAGNQLAASRIAAFLRERKRR